MRLDYDEDTYVPGEETRNEEEIQDKLQTLIQETREKMNEIEDPGLPNIGGMSGEYEKNLE